MTNPKNRLVTATLNYLESRNNVEVTEVSREIFSDSSITTIRVNREIYDLLNRDNFPGKIRKVDGSYAETSLSKRVASENGFVPYTEYVRFEW